MSGQGPVDFKHDPDTDFAPIDELDADAARAEARALREAIAHHDRLYYVENAPAIADTTYDRLFQRLVELEEAFTDLQTENSPTQRVGGAPLDELEDVRHEAPLLSLQAFAERDDVEHFLDGLEEGTGLVLEPKFDGLSIELVYDDGALSRAATRGDGYVGDDITANAKTIRSLPLRLAAPDEAPGRLAVRGEILLGKGDFQALNKARIEVGEEPFANPRNAAAGTARRLDPRAVAAVPLDLVVYEVLAAEAERPPTHWAELETLARQGFKTDQHNRKAKAIADVEGFHRELEAARDDLDWDIDGVVVKVDDLAVRERLGTRARTPRWAVAWKFPPRREVTRLVEIVVQVGTTGILTPVALLEPVDVGGVTVSRATLHNESEVARKDVREGDKVRLERAGDVIPEIVERVPERGRERKAPFAMPERCPSCGASVVREGAYVLCPAGLACPAQLRGRLVHYGGRDAMDIDGLGTETARRLVEQGLVTDLADLYALEPDALAGLEGFAERSAAALHDAIQAATRPRLDRFLYALAIRHVGSHVARVLAEHFDDLDALMAASVDALEAVPEIGPATARSVHGFFAEADNRDVLERLREAGVRPQPVAGAGGGPLEGKTFVFTGALEGYTRSEAEAAVERLGGRATDSVSGNTDYVVCGADPGAKRDEALERDVPILDEAGFEALLREARGR